MIASKSICKERLWSNRERMLTRKKLRELIITDGEQHLAATEGIQLKEQAKSSTVYSLIFKLKMV